MSGVTERLKMAIADRYVIERELGQGGMATVYLAHDVKHDRKVALKVLRPELAAVIGADRFLAEIKTTANLQHPHILALFESGESDGFVYYVMPFVEGESLRDRIMREHQLPVDEAVRIAREAADALEYAHGHGVVHRDIKPENIMLHGGHALVADFGIALAVSRSEGGTRMTETGMSLGTPHYMSPEQAMGEREITPRADVYALGCVLYEMLTGEPPFTGATAQAIIARVMTERPRTLTIQRHTIPPHVEAAVLQAIEKLPADRFPTAGEFARALADSTFSTARPATGGFETAPARPTVEWRRFAWPAVAAALAGAALLGWLRSPPAPTVARYGLAFPPGQELLDINNQTFALAPDGSWIVYDGPAESGSQLWIKRRDAYEATPLPGTDNGGGSAPAVSPDGEWIVFTTAGQLRKVPRGGGSAITLADSVNTSARGVAWLDDGTIVYRGAENQLRRVPDVGGVAEVVWTPPEEQDMRPRLPTPLPDARGVLFATCIGGTCDAQTLRVLDLRSGEARELVPDVSQGWYTATGHLVYVRPDGGAFAAPFDLGSLAITGPAVPVLEGIKSDLGWYPDFSLSASGSLLMIAGPSGGGAGTPSEAVWVSRDGVVTPVDPDWRFSVAGNYGWALSPDGGRLAITLLGPSGNDIWIKELDGGPVSRLTVEPAQDIRPRWTPDGRTVSFISPRGGVEQGVYARRADGTLPVESVLVFEEPVWEALWSRDNQWLVLRTGGAAGTRDIWGQRVGVDSVPQRLLASDFDERAVTLSPDGRWLAYQSDETGQNEIYVRPFPEISTGKWTVSLGGGTQPLWAHSGRELFYVDGEGQMMIAAGIRASTTIEVTERRALFPVDAYLVAGNYTPFDVSPDDQRFLMVRAAGSGEGAPATALILVENWFEELKEKVGR